MGLELANIPQILKMLGAEDRKSEIGAYVDYIKSQDPKKPALFFGDAAVEINEKLKTGPVHIEYTDQKTNEKIDITIEQPIKNAKGQTITKTMVEDALLEQLVGNGLEGEKRTLGKAQAAVIDLETITEINSRQDLPKWPLKPVWGNNNISGAKQPALIDGVSAAANIAANMTLLANDTPELAQNIDVINGVKAASDLALGIAGKGEMPLSRERADELKKQMEKGLRAAAEGLDLKDQKGDAVKLDDFIKARMEEVNKGIDERLKIQGAAKQAVKGQWFPVAAVLGATIAAVAAVAGGIVAFSKPNQR